MLVLFQFGVDADACEYAYGTAIPGLSGWFAQVVACNKSIAAGGTGCCGFGDGKATYCGAIAPMAVPWSG